MKVLVVGKTGQLATELLKTVPDGVELLSPDRDVFTLADHNKCYDYVRYHKPTWVINAGAYTRVDDAEENETDALQLNFESPVHIAAALQITGGNLLQISTDYVFDGKSVYPYERYSPLNPINAYGRSKARAEEYIKFYVPKTRTAVVRTSWLYSATGNNFVKTMLKQFREHGEARVVADQYGCPTAAAGLAKACWSIVNYGLYGVFHWTDGTPMSWADFADAIAEEAFELKLIDKRPIVRRVRTDEFPCKAKRPKYSVLDCTESYEYLGQGRPDWRTNLRTVLQELA